MVALCLKCETAQRQSRDETALQSRLSSCLHLPCRVALSSNVHNHCSNNLNAVGRYGSLQCHGNTKERIISKESLSLIILLYTYAQGSGNMVAYLKHGFWFWWNRPMHYICINKQINKITWHFSFSLFMLTYISVFLHLHGKTWSDFYFILFFITVGEKEKKNTLLRSLILSWQCVMLSLGCHFQCHRYQIPFLKKLLVFIFLVVKIGQG